MYSLGFDVGGTTVKTGLVSEEHGIIKKLSAPTPYGDAGALASLIAALAAELAGDLTEVERIGVSVPGTVEAASVVKKLPNLGILDAPLGELVKRATGHPKVTLCNDADAAAVAELYSGSLKGVKTGLLVTIGTGLGAGVILGGRLFTGGLGRGTELGHMILSRGGMPCGCGGRGCAETLCSATALARAAQGACNERRGMIYSLSEQGAPVDAKLLIDCAMAGDEYAVSAFNAYIDALSDALASCVNILDPEVIAIGGGVCAAGEFLLAPLREQTACKCYFGSCGRIVRAEAGNDAGMIGAAMVGA